MFTWHLFLSILFFLTINPINSHAQELSKMYVVGTAELRENEFVSESNKDQNGEVCAVITIVTDLEGVPAFEAGAGIVKVDNKPGESNLYISPGERKLTIRLSGFEPLEIILSNHGISKIESGKVWRLKITGDRKILADTGKGTLVLTSEPSGAVITVENFPDIKGTTPRLFKDYAAQLYLVKLSKNRYVTADTVMVIRKDKADSLHIKLVPLYGNVTFVSEPPGADVLVDGTAKGKTPLNLFGETNGLDAGSHEITLNYQGPHREAFAPYKETIQLKPGETVTVNMTFTPIKGLLSISSNQLNVAYKITDIETNKIIYDNPDDPNQQVIIGNYRIEATSPGYAAITQEVSITESSNQPIQITFTDSQREEFKKVTDLKRKTFIKSFIIPGTGQLYAGKKGKGTLIMALQISAIGGAAASTMMLNQANTDYDKAYTAYKNATTLDDISKTSKEAQAKYDKASTMSTLQMGAIGAAVGIYLWNVIDATFTKPDTKPAINKASIEVTPSLDGVLLSMRF